jgi:hypothetical protein
MKNEVHYSAKERFWLWALAISGFLILNGAFLYGLADRDLVFEAVTNPLALAFVVEAFILMGVLAYLLAKWNVTRLSWQWFVFLSVIGGLAFAVPIALLWRRPDTANTSEE